nr:unknown [Streptococcus mutans]
MANKKIKDMIATIENFAQEQEAFPVYNILGEIHTYGELKADSDSLAAHLDQLDLTAKSPVVVFGGQEYAMLASFVALTKSGHAYIPIDHHSALEAIEAILEVAEPSLVIAVDDFPIDNLQVPVIQYSQLEEIFKQKLSYQINHAVKGDDTYYIIFTSGTTGKPKGVQISHDNLLSFTNWMINAEAFAIPHRPQMLAQPPYSFDLSVMYWAPTLALGGTLFALPKEITADFKQLFTTITNYHWCVDINTFFVDMAMLSDDFNAQQLPHSNSFYFDGEELTVKTAKNCVSVFRKQELSTLMGQQKQLLLYQLWLSLIKCLKHANVCQLAIQNQIRQPLLLMSQVINWQMVSKERLLFPVRQSLRGISIILNEQQQLSLNLKVCQLIILVIWPSMTDEGLLLYGGRMDFQIKFNGYRIELEEVSQNLNKSQYIASAVAVPRYNKDHKVQNLLAYVVLKDGVEEQFERALDITKAIKADLQDVIMDYMMPSKFLYRKDLPLTPNGKIDIKGLMSEVNKK